MRYFIFVDAIVGEIGTRATLVNIFLDALILKMVLKCCLFVTFFDSVILISDVGLKQVHFLEKIHLPIAYVIFHTPYCHYVNPYDYFYQWNCDG